MAIPRIARIANQDARQYVQRREPFEGSHLFARDVVSNNGDEPMYVVWSYGGHFPIYVYHKETDQWFGNKDKFSQSTTRHQRQARPTANITWATAEMMRGIVNNGLIHMVGRILDQHSSALPPA